MPRPSPTETPANASDGADWVQAIEQAASDYRPSDRIEEAIRTQLGDAAGQEQARWLQLVEIDAVFRGFLLCCAVEARGLKMRVPWRVRRQIPSQFEPPEAI